jgi:hypothetical protein
MKFVHAVTTLPLLSDDIAQRAAPQPEQSSAQQAAARIRFRRHALRRRATLHFRRRNPQSDG